MVQRLIPTMLITPLVHSQLRLLVFMFRLVLSNELISSFSWSLLLFIIHVHHLEESQYTHINGC